MLHVQLQEGERTAAIRLSRLPNVTDLDAPLRRFTPLLPAVSSTVNSKMPKLPEP